MYACATPLNFTKQIHSFRVIFILYVMYVVIFAIISFFPIKQILLTLQEYNIIYY